MTMLISEQEHRKAHVELHRKLDELVADYLLHNPGKLPSTTTLMELMQWSHGQTTHPTPLED